MELNRLKKESKDLIPYYKKALRLSLWRIKSQIVSDPGYENLADINMAPGRKEAFLTLTTAIESKNELRHLIIHELVHLFFSEMEDAMLRWGKQLPESQQELFAKEMADATERIVDDLTQVLRRKL